MIARSRRRWEPISFCAERGMTDERAADQAQYLVSWLSILKSDKKGGVAAASKASEAASFSQSRNDCYWTAGFGRFAVWRRKALRSDGRSGGLSRFYSFAAPSVNGRSLHACWGRAPRRLCTAAIRRAVRGTRLGFDRRSDCQNCQN